VEPKLTATANVMVALALVARGMAPLGIVYATDAQVEPNVKVIGTFPEDSHPPIVYPVAATKTAKPGVLQYLDFLRTGTAKTKFETYGFSMLVPSSS
jgi:molybdate transport system substrate-binding protein